MNARSAARLAWSLCGLTLALTAGIVVLAVLLRSEVEPDRKNAAEQNR